MNGSVSAAAARYLAAAFLPDDAMGRSYATTHPREVVGPISPQASPACLRDHRGQDAAFEALIRLTGAGHPARLAAPG